MFTQITHVSQRLWCGLLAVLASLVLVVSGMSPAQAEQVSGSGKWQSTGNNELGNLSIPSLPSGTQFKSITPNGGTTFFLRSDGTVAASGNSAGMVDSIPSLPSGVKYVDLAGAGSLVLLRSDGEYAVTGAYANDPGFIGGLPPGVTYRKLLGNSPNLRLRSDNKVEIVGQVTDLDGDLEGPTPWVKTVTNRTDYVEGAIGAGFALLLRADGKVKSVVWDRCGGITDCLEGTPEFPLGGKVPSLPKGVTFKKVVTNGEGYAV